MLVQWISQTFTNQGDLVLISPNYSAGPTMTCRKTPEVRPASRKKIWVPGLTLWDVRGMMLPAMEFVLTATLVGNFQSTADQALKSLCFDVKINQPYQTTFLLSGNKLCDICLKNEVGPNMVHTAMKITQKPGTTTSSQRALPHFLACIPWQKMRQITTACYSNLSLRITAS